MGGTGLVDFLELPYDDFISMIVWEAEKAPEAARLIGIESVEELVGLLEGASLHESRFGYHKVERRLVFNSMRCLKHCMEVLRLASAGLLLPDPHSHCGLTNECISPGLRSLSRYASQYTTALDKEIFHKNKRKGSNWMLIFYSLCIQAHVRRAMMLLDQRRHQLLGPSDTSGVKVPAASYLGNAVFLFRATSWQNQGRLLEKICTWRAPPSVYLQQHRQATGPGDTSSNTNSWERWHTNPGGPIGYIDRMFEILPETNPADLNHAAQPILHPQVSGPRSIHHDQTPAPDDADSDSEGTIVGSPIAAASTIAAAETPAAATASSRIVVQGNSIAYPSDLMDVDVGYCPFDFLPTPGRETPTPVPSVFTRTTRGQDSGASSFVDSEWGYSSTRTPSRQSESGDMSYDSDFNDFQRDEVIFGYGAWRDSTDQ